MTITYEYHSNLYVNLTNRVPTGAPSVCAPTAPEAFTPTTCGWSGNPPKRKFWKTSKSGI